MRKIDIKSIDLEVEVLKLTTGQKIKYVYSAYFSSSNILTINWISSDMLEGKETMRIKFNQTSFQREEGATLSTEYLDIDLIWMIEASE